ncbi:hypothetical protein FA10DRAFT_268932 [Acaromyces ingoldii]|uniref:Uncharacterized protein n=1 Tax=Acaromyces ingoldii TaxID=215250 RepID=A0A316YH80_9BASI|nr:hypothetical protein FA10DRAFT_268932 [Acaromyces ingoldii]PWN88787.1 hypothetical protein FA10DRAFT_268932 [Acaromyces ingoldii]
MSYSLYDATVVMAKGALKSLDRMLSEAEKHPNSATFLTARLIEDMKPLTFQVHYATFQAEAMAAKLSGQEYAAPEEDLDSYEKIHARIQQAQNALDTTDKDTVNRLGETTTSFVRREEPIQVPVKALVGLLNMPNVYFHVTMAYAILRKEGVPLGKRDWSRGFVSDYI